MECPSWYFSKALSHNQKVRRLYKRCLRNLDSFYLPDVMTARFHKVVMRARFDKYKDEKDMRVLRTALVDGVRELWAKAHPAQLEFRTDPRGVAFQREGVFADVLYDLAWTPQDKARFPRYFALREQRKKELINDYYDKLMEEKEADLDEKLKLQVPNEKERVDYEQTK